MSDKAHELIYEKIPLVMKEIGVIEKTEKNKEQNYSFRGIDNLYNAINQVLARHGVFCVPTAGEMTREERKSSRGNTLLYTILRMKYTFYATDGSSLDAHTVGEAMDSGDKSCNKAMSAAQKYAFLQVFCIPTEEPKDTENETHEVAPKNTVVEYITPSQVEKLKGLIAETETDIKKFLSYFKIESLEKLPITRYAEAVKLVEAKKKKSAGK